MLRLEACRRCLTGFTFALTALSLTGLPALAEQSYVADRPSLAPIESARAFSSDGHVVGLQALLVKGGEVAHYGQDGVRDVETSTPVQPGTLYRTYSMTKPITGVALMQRHEDGKFDHDDPITKYIPEFEALKVLAGENEDGTPILKDPSRPATMRELMSHSAGFA